MIYLRKLHIIGNGFDLHHNMSTSYKHYRKYLFDFGLCSYILEQFPEEDAFWSNVERGLEIDYKKYISDYLEVYNFVETPPGEVVNQNQSTLNNVKKLTQVYSSFLAFTGINFYEWLHKTYCEEIDKTKFDKTLFNLHDENKFITFNYTPLLQDLYKVNDGNILYIHGDIRKVKHDDLYVPKTIRDDIIVERREGHIRNEIQFGNTYNKPIEIGDVIDLNRLKLKNKYISLEDLQLELDYFLRSSFKSIESNFENLEKFIDSCGEIEQVIIMGNNFLEIDFPYYEKILIPSYKSQKWLVYCYNNHDKENALVLKEKYNLDVEIKQWQ